MFTPFPSHTSSKIAWAEQRLSQQRLHSPISWEGAKWFSLREQVVVLIPFPSTFCWQTLVVPETWALRSPVWCRCLRLRFCYACCWLVPVYISIVFCLAVGKWCTCSLTRVVLSPWLTRLTLNFRGSPKSWRVSFQLQGVEKEDLRCNYAFSQSVDSKPETWIYGWSIWSRTQWELSDQRAVRILVENIGRHVKFEHILIFVKNPASDIKKSDFSMGVLWKNTAFKIIPVSAELA